MCRWIPNCTFFNTTHTMSTNIMNPSCRAQGCVWCRSRRGDGKSRKCLGRVLLIGQKNPEWIHESQSEEVSTYVVRRTTILSISIRGWLITLESVHNWPTVYLARVSDGLSSAGIVTGQAWKALFMRTLILVFVANIKSCYWALGMNLDMSISHRCLVCFSSRL
jgi:hypothetical protein